MWDGVPWSGGDFTCADLISGLATFALAIGGSMLWVRWRDRRDRREQAR